MAASLMDSGNMWFPELVSSIGGTVDFAFWFIMILSIIFSVGIVGVMGWFMWRYRRRKGNEVASEADTHNTVLELTWTIVPLILVLIIFYIGFRGYMAMVVVPPDAMEINVVAKKWLWEFKYPGGSRQTMGELVVPVDTPIRLVMYSDDVIHGFFVPNFRIKKDVVPNRYTYMWFEANKIGQYQLFCTEFCGDGHSKMLGVVKVVSKSDYTQWLTQATTYPDTMAPEQIGKQIYQNKGCVTCHSIDGTPNTGPTWKSLFGKPRLLTDGRTVEADENYLRRAIVEPAVEVTNGYRPEMPSYKGSLSDEEINGVIMYIKSLK